MMIEVKNKLHVGGKFRLKHATNMCGTPYSKGFEFTIYGEGPRGYDIITDSGHRITETAFKTDLFQPINRVTINFGG